MRHDALVARARLLMRRGDEGAEAAVDEAVGTGFEIGEHIRVVLSAAVAAEWCWTAGTDDRCWDDHITSAVERSMLRGDTWGAAEIAFWQIRRGDRFDPCHPVQMSHPGRAIGAATRRKLRSDYREPTTDNRVVPPPLSRRGTSAMCVSQNGGLSRHLLDRPRKEPR